MSKQREYLVAVSAWSTNHIWIKAASEDEACEKAGDLWANGDTDDFVPKGGQIETVTVLDDREVRP